MFSGLGGSFSKKPLGRRRPKTGGGENRGRWVQTCKFVDVGKQKQSPVFRLLGRNSKEIENPLICILYHDASHNHYHLVTEQSDGVKREDERCFEPTQKVIQEFEIMKGATISAIDTGTFKGKHQRCELLVLLKDKAGLKYREIAESEIFGDLSFASLQSLYRNMKKKKTED